MRAAWTVIELVFIIIIIGVLAAIALPKLAATRNDAKLSTDVSKMSVCLRDVGSAYTATATDLTEGDSDACDAVTCYDITYSINGSNFIVAANPNAANFCSDIINIGGHLVGTYKFSGTLIQR